MPKVIKVLGTGCPKCNALYENVVKALEELREEAQIVKVTDIKEIVQHRVAMTPALAINDKVVSQGKVLSAEEIKKLLQQ
ncbi:redox-active disulfide protein 2 [Thermosulfidibacter takaii ABI70S6]|uniref:Redox-active disulfide protein 2 n=1 Tax=Thermosulfidibacter takaii (strain DSM 17441 / JCM 13301 / NBRC 103674 / ABI70S6) TaxID=1298851 RepID=A0A0S3QRV3_THET7|nr:thioredoxin family protein [Thermosulfidibacter takaii]BAT71059.1 redox-active disulfide protein 2 [Thermosulfidibacter takaii ABI70S6]